MSKSADSNSMDDRSEEAIPDYTPALIDDPNDNDDESDNGGRQPIDISGELLDPAELENLMRPRSQQAHDNNGKDEIVALPVEAPDSQALIEANAAQAAQREADLLAEIDNQKNNYLRAVADLHNYRRRSDEEMKRIRANAAERLIKEILPLVDDLDLCIQAAKGTESYDQLITGVEAIYRKFGDALGKEGVDPVPSIGEPFNPDLHDAVMLDTESEEPDGTVTAELRKGYTMNGRLIRPALVKVAGS